MLTGHVGWTDQKISRKRFNELEFSNYLCLAGGQLCPAHDLYQAWTSSIHSATDTGLTGYLWYKHLESIVLDTFSLFCHNPAVQRRILQDRFSGCMSAFIVAFICADCWPTVLWTLVDSGQVCSASPPAPPLRPPWCNVRDSSLCCAAGKSICA